MNPELDAFTNVPSYRDCFLCSCDSGWPNNEDK